MDLVKPAPETTDLERNYLPGKRVKVRDLRKLVLSHSVKPGKCVRAISVAATQLAFDDLDTVSKLKRLANYRVIVQVLKPHLNDQMAGPLIPRGTTDTALYGECDRMYSNLADAADRVLLSATDDDPLSHKQKHQAAQSGYWAIEFLAERLRCAYSCYARVPLGVWSDIHRIYQYATSRNLEHKIVEIGKGLETSDIEHLYKRVVVFGLSDPYQLPFRSVHSVFDSLDEWASKVRLEHEPIRNSCLFEINLDTDFPAMPVLNRRRSADDKSVIYVDTSRLVGFLNKNLIEINDATKSPNASQRKINEELEHADIVKKLIVKLGIQPYRRADRTQEERKCQAAVGLHSVVRVIQKSGERDSMEPNNFNVKTIDLIDESEFGARIRISNGNQKETPIGELIAIRKGNDTWSIGLIRWVQIDKDKQIQAGVYKFIDNYVPVFVKQLSSLDEKPISPPSIPGIWTIREKKDQRLASLIVAAGTYKPKQTVIVSKGKVEHALEMQEVILSSRHFVWSNVSLSGSNPKLTLELLHPIYI